MEERKRTVNFTSDEKAILTELIIKYRDQVENKKTDSTTNADKARGWKLLSDEFNSISIYCKRTPDGLKTCWENIKRQKRKQSASQKREIFKTGGGRPPPPPPSNGADRMVETILGPSLEGLENIYDSDALLDKNSKDINIKNYYTQIGSEIDFAHTVVVESVPSSSSCSFVPIAETSKKQNEQHILSPTATTSTTSQPQLQMDENNDNNLKWEGWTPNSLKRPISEVLSSKENNSTWLKRRRPDKLNLNDQLIQEKINLVKLLKEESKKRNLILDEQLKQEKIKTQQLLN